MGYITSIVDMKGKAYQSLEFSGAVPEWSDGGYRLESNRAHVAFCDYAPLEETVGVGISPVDGCWTFVTHDKKAAYLHRYIEVAETFTMPFDQMGEYSIIAFGCNRSVVLWTDKNFRSICTVYDLLIYMCRATGENLLNENLVSFGNRSLGWILDITLSHTDEANRFYTKMWLDVVGNYEGHLKGYR